MLEVTTFACQLGLTSPQISDGGALILDPASGQPIWSIPLPPGHAEEILTWLNHWKAAAVTYRSLTHVAVLDLEEQLADELVTCFSPNLRLHVVKSFIAYNGLWAVEFTGAGVTKATAATKLIHMMGTKPSRVIAAGDSYNDLPLLRMCGLRIAMGNAPTELKAIADYIAPPVEEDGLAVAIEEFVVPRL